uniref:PLOD1-3-like GT domain-containing protein n=1 Tax=viral metagenome TaxID=1070528 RepID=A0A6H1ZG62_9ZZZZ
MHVCTTFYDPSGQNAATICTSAARHGIAVANFGAKSRFDGFLRTKLIPLRNHLAGVANDIVLFLDGNDTIIEADEKEILAAWGRFGGVVVGSELVNWPYAHLKGKMDALAAKAGSKSPYHYLDTGLIMGRRQEVIGVLDAVIASVPQYAAAMPATKKEILEDDVGLFALNITDGRIGVTIDYGCALIAALRNVNDRKAYSFVGGRLFLRATKTKPCVVHCNGHRKVDRLRLIRLSEKLIGKPGWKMKKA